MFGVSDVSKAVSIMRRHTFVKKCVLNSSVSVRYVLLVVVVKIFLFLYLRPRSGRRYYILPLKFLSFFSPQDLRDGSNDREPF